MKGNLKVKTYEITQTRTFNKRKRYQTILLTFFHNHMRIIRIICNLTMIEFGRMLNRLVIS